MLRVVVVTSVMHAVVGFAQVPRNTAQESLETRGGTDTGPTVQCGEKVTKRCLAQKVDAMGAQLNTFMIEGPHYDMMSSIRTQVDELQSFVITGPQYERMLVMEEQINDLQAQMVGVKEEVAETKALLQQLRHLMDVRGYLIYTADRLQYQSSVFPGPTPPPPPPTPPSPPLSPSTPPSPPLSPPTPTLPPPPPSLPQGEFTSRGELKAAINEWVNDRTTAHGPIAGWDTSRVEDMSGYCAGYNCFGLFPPTFNGDIGGWDTSSLVELRGTFDGATAFDKPLGGWDTAKVAVLNYVFNGATAFNQPDLARWDVAAVTNPSDIGYTFDGTALKEDQCSKRIVYDG